MCYNLLMYTATHGLIELTPDLPRIRCAEGSALQTTVASAVLHYGRRRRSQLRHKRIRQQAVQAAHQ